MLPQVVERARLLHSLPLDERNWSKGRDAYGSDLRHVKPKELGSCNLAMMLVFR
jgi:hypothetical protein